MTAYGRPDAGTLLGESCPFLGERPEALLLLQADLAHECSWRARETLAANLRATMEDRKSVV